MTRTNKILIVIITILVIALCIVSVKYNALSYNAKNNLRDTLYNAEYHYQELSEAYQRIAELEEQLGIEQEQIKPY